VACWLDGRHLLVGQPREVGGQGGKVIEGHRCQGGGAALVELVEAEPTYGGVPL